MTIGIIGAGHIGSQVARLATRNGHDVVISNSRGPETLADLVKELGPQARAATPEADRPGQVLVAILTDGEENSSTRFTWLDVSKRIRHQSEKYGWQFPFLGANQDAIATAGRMNIDAKHTANFAMTGESYDASKGALSRKMSAIRRRGQGESSADILHDAEAPLETMREEEERRPKS